MEKIYYKRLDQYVTNSKILSPFQFDFRKNYSTEQAMIVLTDTDFIRVNLDKGKVCILVSFDLRKAFDSINRELLVLKLSKYNISDHWLRSYLSLRFQFCEYGGISLLYSRLLGAYSKVVSSALYFFPFLLMTFPILLIIGWLYYLLTTQIFYLLGKRQITYFGASSQWQYAKSYKLD